MKKKVFSRLLVIGLVLGVFGVVFARTGLKTQFNTRYGTTGTILDQCILCHATNNNPDIPSFETPPNPYGVALENNGVDFAAAEPLDSDGDGFTNIIEITQRTFPGNASSYPPSVGILIVKYYNDILDRAPEPGGAEAWTAEIERIVSLGIDIKEGFIAVGKSFFNSAEYLLKAKTNAAYVTDLYETFLQRLPAQAEIDYWVGYLTQGMNRNIALNYFVYSAEFELYMEGIFGVSTARPENDLVNDFYRGILNRLPDTAGFNAWLGLMRTAQCTGAQQVRDLSHQIALGFIQSAEYVARGRTNSQYVADLYDAILRRGALPSEVNYWVNFLNTATREEVLQSFTNSPEFQIRVTEVINAGCL